NPRVLVFGRRGWGGDRGYLERQERSGGTLAGDVLPGCQSASQLRGLLDQRAHVPLLYRSAALAVRVWTELYQVQIQQPDPAEGAPRGRPAAECVGTRHQYGQSGRR